MNAVVEKKKTTQKLTKAEKKEKEEKAERKEQRRLKREQEEEAERKYKNKKKRKHVEVKKEDSVKKARVVEVTQDKTTVDLLNQMVSVRQSDDDDDDSAVEGQMKPIVGVSRNLFEVESLDLEEDNRQIVPYALSSTRPTTMSNDAVVGKMFDCINIAMTQQAAQQEKLLKHVAGEAANEAKIELAVVNGKYQSCKMEVRLEMAEKENEKKDNKIKALKAALKKANEEIALRKQQQPSTLPYQQNNNNNNNNTGMEIVSETVFAHNNNPSASVIGEDELTRENRPALSFVLNKDRQFDKSIAALVHCRAEIHAFNFGDSASTIVVPLTGVYCLNQLWHVLSDRPISENTKEFEAIAQVGIHLESNCFTLSPVAQHNPFFQAPMVNKGYAFDESNKKASEFNYAVLLQAICSQEIVHYLFTVAKVGEPTEGACDEEEEEDDDNQYGNRNQKKKSKSITQTKEDKKIKKVFDASFQTGPKMNGLLCSIPLIEKLPLTPPHCSTFMGIPVKPDYVGKKSQGGWKECIMCGAHCTFAQQKDHLTNHIPKSCPFCLLSCAKQYNLSKPLAESVAKVISSINRQLCIYDEVYKKIRNHIIVKYAKFFRNTKTTAPASFTATLIYANGSPYNKSELDLAIKQILDAGRQATYNYARHVDKYQMHHSDDIRTAITTISEYKRTQSSPSREDVITGLFRHTLVSAMPLQSSGLISIGRHASDMFLDGEIVDPFKQQPVATPIQMPMYNMQQQPSYVQPQQQQMPPLVQQQNGPDQFSLMHDLIICDNAMTKLQSDQKGIISHIENEKRLGSKADLSIYEEQLVGLDAQIKQKQSEKDVIHMNQYNMTNQSKQQSFDQGWNPMAQQQQQYFFPPQQQQFVDFAQFTVNNIMPLPTTQTTTTTGIQLEKMAIESNQFLTANNNSLSTEIDETEKRRLEAIQSNVESRNNKGSPQSFVVNITPTTEVPLDEQIKSCFTFPNESLSFHTPFGQENFGESLEINEKEEKYPRHMFESDEDYHNRTAYLL